MQKLEAVALMDRLANGEHSRNAKVFQRFKDIDKMINFVNNLDIVNINFNTPPEITDALSPYMTLCTRKKFFCDKFMLGSLEDHEFLQIMMCEIFNCLQDHFYSPWVASKEYTVQGTTLLMMYHIGIIPEKIGYASRFRSQLYTLYKKDYPTSNTISFGPTKEQSEFLFQDMIYGNNELLGKVTQFCLKDFEDVECYCITGDYVYPTQTYGLQYAVGIHELNEYKEPKDFFNRNYSTDYQAFCYQGARLKANDKIVSHIKNQYNRCTFKTAI